MVVPSLAIELEPLKVKLVAMPAVLFGPALATGATCPAWLTVKVWLAMVRIPVREELLVLLSIVKVAVPLPVPELIVCNQVAPLLAVQEQLVPEAVTVTLLLAAAAPEERLVEDKVNVHGIVVKLARQV